MFFELDAAVRRVINHLSGRIAGPAVLWSIRYLIISFVARSRSILIIGIVHENEMAARGSAMPSALRQ